MMDDKKTEIEVLDVEPPPPPARLPNGHWAPGNRAGKGRPPVRAAEIIATALAPYRDEVIQRALHIMRTQTDQAAIGALRLVLDRMAPPLRPEEERVEIPGLAEAPDWESKARAVVESVARGEISARAGQTLMTSIGSYLQAVQADALQKKVEHLESLILGGAVRVIEMPATDVVDATPAVPAKHDLT